MRLLAQIPHPKYKIVAYTLELHYYVEIEAGPMKQCYKLHKDTTSGIEGIKKWLDGEFQTHLQTTFEEMYRQHSAAIKRNSAS